MFTEECTSCGICVPKCPFLQELGSPLNFNETDPSAAFSCALCGRCKTACPNGLYPGDYFYSMRVKAIKDGFIDIRDYRYLYPDNPKNYYEYAKKALDVDYSDIEGLDKTLFFPGCNLAVFSPSLTRATYNSIKTKHGGCGFSLECCGRPYYLLGLTDNGKSHAESIANRFAQAGVLIIAFACRGCYYYLKESLAKVGIIADTVYKHLSEDSLVAGEGKITIHDACPDRFQGVYANDTRDILIKCGYDIVEMDSSKENSICCGSGGMLSNFREDLTKKHIEMRAGEVRKVGVDTVTAACLSCVMKLCAADIGNTKACHILNMVLGVEPDYIDIKKRVKDLITEEMWAEMNE
jgi:Fe-S oxidoreductase